MLVLVRDGGTTIQLWGAGGGLNSRCGKWEL